jgi:hypothetical protein
MANDARNAGQRGEGKLGGILSLLAFLAFCYSVFNIAPVYMADYSLADKMVEVCRLHPTQAPEDKIRDLLMMTVRDENLSPYITKADFKIQVRDTARRISIQYQRDAKVLPGWTHTFKFSHETDQPFF